MSTKVKNRDSIFKLKIDTGRENNPRPVLFSWLIAFNTCTWQT